MKDHALPDRIDTLISVAAVASASARGPHLLEASVGARAGGARSVTALGQQAARRRALQGIGWRHSALALGDGSSSARPLTWVSAARWWFDRSSVARTLTAAQPDIIETAEPFVLGGAVLAAADRLGVPAVALCHSDPLLGLRTGIGQAPGADAKVTPRRGHWVERQALGLLQRVYEGYDLVLAPSRSMTSQLHAMGVAHAAYQPIGIDCGVFTPNAGDHAWRRGLEARLQLTPGTRLLLYVGRFGARMRLDQLAEAVRRLGPGHVLLAMGEGPCAPTGEAVRCLPNEPSSADRARLMASCDAFVHAGGQAEHGSLALLEAMACGLPVVVSRTGVLGEMAHGAGTTVAGTRVEEWAEAMRAAVVSPSWVHFWAALERARSHDWGVVVRQQALHYRQAIGGARAGRETSVSHQGGDRGQPALSH